MSIDSGSSSPIFGFLSILELEDNGYCGGLLLLDRIGRPVEFHCTVPVQTDPAQRILYGRTHKSFVYCDQIGRALIEKAGRVLSLVVVDDPTLCELNIESSGPVVMPLETDPAGEASDLIQIDEQSFQANGVDDQGKQSVVQLLQQFTHLSYIAEPFERIRDAIAQAKMAA